MAVSQQQSLYEQVVKITDRYLGPAAERFIERQIQSHLHKQPEKLAQKDLEKLIDWIQVAIAFLTDDSGLIDEYISSLTQLNRGTKKSGKG